MRLRRPALAVVVIARDDRPVSSRRGYQLPYVPGADREERLASAVALARWAVTTNGLHPQHRVRVAKQALWFATECDGKLTPRFRTREAMTFEGSRYWSVLQHEHVVPLRILVDRMFAAPDDIEQIVREAAACLVTREEHQRLTPLDRTYEGWERYRQSGIEVVDALTGELFLSLGPTGTTIREMPVGVFPPHGVPRPQPLAPAARSQGAPTSGLGAVYTEFWAMLRPRLAEEHGEWSALTAQGNSQGFTGAAPNTRFQFDFARQGLRHQLLLCSTSADENERRLMDLASAEDELLQHYGEPIKFEVLPGRTQCRVADYLPDAMIGERDRWDEYAEWLLSSGIRLRTALRAIDFG